MNFFQSLFALQVTGDWKITIRQNADLFIVSVLLCNDNCGDNAKNTIPPLVLEGTAAELDEGFINAIAAPVKATSALLLNMESYLKAQEEAKKQSAMQKDSEAKAERDKTDKQKKYEGLLKKSEELEAEGKYREAWMKMPEISEYPEHEEFIRSRKSSLSAQFAPTLFNS